MVGDETECKLCWDSSDRLDCCSVYLFGLHSLSSRCVTILRMNRLFHACQHLQRIEGLDDIWQDLGLTLSVTMLL